jgi:hypothetical protein
MLGLIRSLEFCHVGRIEHESGDMRMARRRLIGAGDIGCRTRAVQGATTLLMPVSCRRGLVDLSGDVATKVQVLFYADAADALRKALHEG